MRARRKPSVPKHFNKTNSIYCDWCGKEKEEEVKDTRLCASCHTRRLQGKKAPKDDALNHKSSHFGSH